MTYLQIEQSKSGHPIFRLALLASLLCLKVLFGAAQTVSPAPSPPPTRPADRDFEGRISVLTEEVILPVTARDSSGHLSSALEPHDIIVFEDSVRQKVTSIRRLPASVLLLLDTAGEQNPGMRVSTTREIAIRLVSKLRTGDRVAAIQFGREVELFQNWTTDKEQVLKALETKLISGKKHQLTRALVAAANYLREAPAGTRHLVLVTDGVDLSADEATLTDAIGRLLPTNVTVHVISYGAVGRKTIDQQNPLVRVTNKRRKTVEDIIEELMHPAVPPEYKKRTKIYVIVDTDFSMRRRRNAYEKATRVAEVWLKSLAEETGGLFFAPTSVTDMPAPADEIAREIDSQYAVSYTPARPVADAQPGERREIRVFSGLGGLQVRARRKYVARD
jgi:VWFA-related protein